MVSDGTTSEGPRFDMRTQYLALLACSLTSLGDAVEIYLPSVITQPLSCELGITSHREVILGVSLYISSGLLTALLFPVANRLGRRRVLLAASYLAIAAAIATAIVPSYSSLLASRVLLGVTIAMNLTVRGVYMAEVAATKEFYTIAITLIGALFSVGGGWCGLLGYLLLDRLGWRFFVILTSAPIFILPLVLFQFYLPESLPPRREHGNDESMMLVREDRSEASCAVSKTPDITPELGQIIKKIVKVALCTVTWLPYYGAILLIPAIAKAHNISIGSDEPCGAIHGAQFLIVTALFGGCHATGRALSYLLQGTIPSAWIFTLQAVLACTSITIMNVYPSHVVVVFVAMGLVQITGAIMSNEIDLVSNDRDYFTWRYLPLSSGVRMATLCLVVATGNVLPGVMDYRHVLHVHVVLAVVGVPVAVMFFIKE